MLPESCRVFISYAHDNETHKENALDYSNWLNTPGGLNCWIDRYVEDADLPEGWPAWMRNQINLAKYVLVVCSARYAARFNRQPEEDGQGKGAKWESVLMETQIYQKEGLNHKFIPVLFNSVDEKYIPEILQNTTFFDLSNAERRDALYRRLTNQPLHSKPAVSGIILLTDEDRAEVEAVEMVNQPEIVLSTLKELFEMKPGTKIMQMFFSLPITRRFSIAQKLNLVFDGETLENSTDKTYASFLHRAFENKVLSQLWSELFDENIDPNPFNN